MVSFWQTWFSALRFLQLAFSIAVVSFHAVGYSTYQNYVTLVIENSLPQRFNPSVPYSLWFAVASISIIASGAILFFTCGRPYVNSPAERKLAIVMTAIWLISDALIMSVDGGFRDPNIVYNTNIVAINRAETHVYWCWNLTCAFAIVTILLWSIAIITMYLWLEFVNTGDHFIAEEDSDIYSPWRMRQPLSPAGSSRMVSTSSRMPSMERISPMTSPISRSYKSPREVARLSWHGSQGPITPTAEWKSATGSVASSINDLPIKDGSIHSAGSKDSPPSSGKPKATSRSMSTPMVARASVVPQQDPSVSVEVVSEDTHPQLPHPGQQRRASLPMVNLATAQRQDEHVVVEHVVEHVVVEQVQPAHVTQQYEVVTIDVEETVVMEATPTPVPATKRKGEEPAQPHESVTIDVDAEDAPASPVTAQHTETVAAEAVAAPASSQP